MADDKHKQRRTTDRDHTTIIHTSDRSGGGGTTVVAVFAVILLLVVLLFVAFGGWLRNSATEVSMPENIGVNVSIDAPETQLPDINVPKEDEPGSSTEGNES